MIAWTLLLLPAALAIGREAVLDHAAEFASHTWTMGADNETASCDSGYRSDFDAGDVIVGVPYDWGGWVTIDEFEDDLANSYGAGSHSWDGVLWCTTGVDCSGFVSQVWETSQKYGTSTFYQVTTDISLSDIRRADAFNKSGSHIVLWAYETDAGSPVFYHAGGDPVQVQAGYSWSYLSGFQPVRYNDIEEGPTTGTIDDPIEIRGFPYSHTHWTAGAASDAIDDYACSPGTDESGPEVLYHFQTATGGVLSVVVSDESSVDVDVHVLDAPSGDACLARDDTELSIQVADGDVWIAVDTWVGSGQEYPGPYVMTATFDGDLDPSGDDTGEPGDTADTGNPDTGGSDDSPEPPPSTTVRPPGELVAMDQVGKGCGCTSGGRGPGPGWWGLLGLAAFVRRRRDPGPQ